MSLTKWYVTKWHLNKAPVFKDDQAYYLATDVDAELAGLDQMRTMLKASHATLAATEAKVARLKAEVERLKAEAACEVLRQLRHGDNHHHGHACRGLR